MRAKVHYTLVAPTTAPDVLSAAPKTPLSPRYNIVPGQAAPVCVRAGEGRQIEMHRWGLLPRWRGHGGKRGPMIDTVALDACSTIPLVRDAFKRSRCLVIADGFFALRSDGTPTWVHPDPLAPVGFAGVVATSADDQIASFALLLDPAEPRPIVIAAQDHATWLDPTALADAALACATQTAHRTTWRSDVVSRRMESGRNDDPSCIAIVGNPNQRELF